MKKLIFLSGIFALLIFMNSCKKDKAFDLKELPGKEQVSATQRKRSCGMAEHTKKLLEDPSYRRFHEQKFERLRSMTSDRSACSTPVILPIAVHFQGVANPDINCLRQLAQSQIDVLNADYTGTNSDISTWNNSAATFFPGVSNGETCVKFCLATKNHPSGYGLSEGEPAVTVNKTTGDQDSNWAGYINIFVQANTGVLGYSPLGGAGNGDGVVIDANAFGTGAGCGSISPNAPYNLGRTLTHEMGHYLLLDHIWGGGCGQDDGVADTPDSEQSYYDCPSLGVSTCGSTDMHMNYMDYTNDECMYMFSAGQSGRMENYFNSSLQSVISNAANVCAEGGSGGGGTTPTCSDGIQNGSETGVDCGGPDCSPCNPTPTACDTPANVSVTANETSAEVSFDAVAGASAYEIKYNETGATTFTTLTTSATNATISGLQAATDYELSVRSICGAENSESSAAVNFTTNESTGGGTCGCDGLHLDLELTLDDWGSETTYELIDENEEVVADGGPFQNEANGTVVEDEFCLADGCYSFVVYDEYGDGICCFYGDGGFQLSDGSGDVLVASDGEFGEFEIIDFCVENGEFQFLELRKAARKPTLRKTKPVKNSSRSF
ncbi:MAG TPA: hypothetical protein ENJ95_02025 [Bacteroidetes bacterium]|nr:hypothetical protein [Bacteroidota bacterium]